MKDFEPSITGLPSVCVTPSPEEAAAKCPLPVAMTTHKLCVPDADSLVNIKPNSSRPRLSIPSLAGVTSAYSGSAPATSTSGRRFSFNFPAAIRRASWSIITPTESMVSLNYRSLASFVAEDNLLGLKGFLENRNINVDDRDENGGTVLHLAASRGRFGLVRELINNGADPNAEDNDKWTALIIAAKEGHAQICAELCDHGAAIEHQDMGGWSALMWACYKGRNAVVQVLIERGADVNLHGQYFITPLMWAAGRGHELIVRDLLDRGAKVNVADKHGTTALIWACRKGYTSIVEMLLQSGANVEVSGMHCWTPLLVAARGNYVEIVQKLLEKKPNVNVVDKDGSTALTVACKEGLYEICVALLNAGAYVNLQDRSGDTNLIHAAKAGHRSIVEALLKKHADVDMTGKERKTALYWAVEKNHVSVVKTLLGSDPNLEIATKDGDTALLRAVRNRNVELVHLLLDKKARVSAADKEGDTALHIAMRARSKAIVEVLLRNPKNSQLLYRPNRAGETPYNIDTAQQKTILGQIFGARRLNTNEDNENMLGYDLYSSALADILSEPSLSMPITVGLYAKWGSGKSFLLNKLREEMKGFARQWTEPMFEFSLVLTIIILHFSALLGIVIATSLDSSTGWIAGLATAAGFFAFSHTFLYIIHWGSRRYTWSWTHNVSLALAKRLASIKLVLQVTFCTPPGPQWGGDSIRVQPIRFYFTDQTKVSRSASGENSVVQMIGSLLNSIEADYGVIATRLYRALRPKPLKMDSPWRLRRVCCLPYAVLFIVCLDLLLAGLVLLVIYVQGIDNELIETLRTVLIAIAILIGVVVIANVYTWTRVIQSLLVSQRRKLQRRVSRLHTVKAEGYLQALKQEVATMVEMVRCLDAFSGQQTRLVMVVDGLDSCEQDQVLYVLDAVHLLFTEQSTPFITVLAIDPHIIMKAIELNLHRMFNESNIGGHDYLRNLVHLPFYLQNAGLRKVKIAQQAAATARASRPLAPSSTTNAVLNWLESEDNPPASTAAVSPRRMSTESTSAAMKGLSRITKNPGSVYGGGKKLRASESMESGIGPATGAYRVQAAHDLTKVLLTDDYFSDVNPRSMRRLMNVIYVTGRLLKAFQIEFNWYHLASWVNISEQWPYRTSWMILYCEMFEEKLDDFTSLKKVYDRVKPFIPVSKEVEPLLEMDRDEKKLEIFLGFHKNNLQVLHMKIFLPFTIHLDPYLRKVIKEERTSYVAMETGMPPTKVGPRVDPSTIRPSAGPQLPSWGAPPWTTVTLPTPDQTQNYGKFTIMGNPNYGVVPAVPYVQPMVPAPLKAAIPAKYSEKILSSLTVEDVCEVLRSLEGARASSADAYSRTVAEHNVSGRVLLCCDLDELKKLLSMSFGDWELFRAIVNSMREKEFSSQAARQSPVQMRGPPAAGPAQASANLLDVDYAEHGRMSRSSSIRSAVAQSAVEASTETDSSQAATKFQKRQNLIEKQVTLEEQAICGALQTLNEEALEDVLDERDAEAAAAEMPPLHSYQSSNLSSCSDASEMDVLYLQTSVVPEMPLSGLGASSLALGSLGRLGREDSVSLTSSLASLAERGSVTPARQRTVTEVVWPEHVTALSSGLRSRLGSSTSLFRAGSQKSVVDGGFSLARKNSQRSVCESNTSLAKNTGYVPVNVGQVSISQAVTHRNEQGSPRRPASLVLTDPINSRVDWMAGPANGEEERSRSNSLSSTPTPPALAPAGGQPRFTTTAVGISAENIISKAEPAKTAAVKSPAKHRKRRQGFSHRQPTMMPGKSEAKRGGAQASPGRSSDEDSDREDAPLMSPKHSGKIAVKNMEESRTRIVSVVGSSTSSIDSPLDTTDNDVYKTVIPKSDSSRREHSLANLLNMPLESEPLTKNEASGTPT